MPLDIPTPDSSKLNNHYILGEIIDHVGELSGEFPKVDLEELISQLTQVKSKNFNPEVQLRGFLKVFKKTRTYQDGYSKLDGPTKSRLDAFIQGRSAADVTGQEIPILQPRPTANHRSKLLGIIRRLLGFLQRLHIHKSGVKNLGKDLKATKAPLIYEDEERTKLIKVRQN